MKLKSQLSSILLIIHISLTLAQTQVIEYAEYRKIPQDSTIYKLHALIKQSKDSTADALYQQKLEDLKAQNRFSDYLFYANEYSYKYYVRNTRQTNKPFEILDSALTLTKPHLKNDDFELFLAKYNMNFYFKDNPLERTKWIKSSLKHLDFDKYTFAKPIYSALGSIYYDAQEYDSAWHYWDAIKDDKQIAIKYKASLYQAIGAKIKTHDTDIAIDFIKKSLEILSKDSISPLDNIRSHYWLTGLSTQNADYTEAISYGKKTLQLLEKHKDILEIQSLSNHQIWVHIIESYIHLEQTDSARLWTENLKQNAHKTSRPSITKIRIPWLYSMILDAENKLDSAQYYYDISNKGFLNLTKDSLSRYITNGYYYKAESFQKGKDYKNAIAYYNKALVSFNSTNYQDINDPLKTIPPNQISKSMLIYNIEMLLDLIEAYQEDYINSPNKKTLYTIINLTNYGNDLIKYRFREITNEESALETSSFLKDYCSHGLFAAKELAAEHKEYIDSAFIFADLPKSFTLNYNKQLANSEISKKDQLLMQAIAKQSIQLANAKLNKLSDDEIFELKYQIHRNKSKLSRVQINDYSFMDNSDAFYNIKKNLSPSEAALQITCNGDSCYIICITEDQQSIQLSTINNIEDKIRALTRAIKSNSNWQSASAPFYSAFVAPFERQLKQKDQLSIYADEKLQTIPFSLLGKDGSLLIEQLAIKYHYSAKTLKESSTNSCKTLIMAPGFNEATNIAENTILRSLSLGDSTFRTSKDRLQLSPLPYSITEAKAINAMFTSKEITCQLTTGSKASKQYFIDNSQHFDILHLATHGIAKNKEQTGLFFSTDSSSNEATFLNLNELYMQDISAQLVVLSACQSGLGELATGEGTIGLPRSFIYAGANNIIASLWKVHDANTQVLMTAFYKHLLNDNTSYDIALQRAKLDCIKQGLLPMDWASFVLISE